MSDRPELDPIERSGLDAEPQTNGQVNAMPVATVPWP